MSESEKFRAVEDGARLHEETYDTVWKTASALCEGIYWSFPDRPDKYSAAFWLVFYSELKKEYPNDETVKQGLSEARDAHNALFDNL